LKEERNFNGLFIKTVSSARRRKIKVRDEKLLKNQLATSQDVVVFVEYSRS